MNWFNYNRKFRGVRGVTFRRLSVLLIAMALFQTLNRVAQANGVYLDGGGARSMALGGASVASPDQPLEAMFSNPAGLGFTDSPMIQLGGVGGFAEGDFTDSVNADSHMSPSGGGFPNAAFVCPLKSAPVSLGFSVIPEAYSSTDWHFVDKPGGLDGATTYGLQQNYAEFIAIRAAFGASWKITDTLAIGADLGADYNRNRLIAPYVFQSYAPLRGFKTLLDLQTDGWGVNGAIGLVWRPVEKVSLGLSYRSMTYFDTHGDASGNASVQLQNIGAGAFRPGFHYDAEVSTKLPQSVSAGVSWQARDWVRVVFETDWIDWSGAFDHLNIKLKNGNNADINGFLGTDNFEDNVPLDWKDSFVYRVGLEFPFTPSYTARIGYSYGANPVPTSTLTPMSAAIFEHTITCGLEWHHDHWTVVGAYQYDLPATSNVGVSGLASGEFSNSSTTVEAHTFGLTLGYKF